MTNKPVTAILCGLVAALLGTPAAAQSSLVSVNDWQFEFVPYLWLSGIRSDLQLGPLPTDKVSISSSSVLKALDFGAMGTFEARKGAWGGLLDLQYVKLGVDQSKAGGLLGTYALKYEQSIATLAGFYRVVDAPVTVDVLAGLRYVDIKTELSITPSLAGPGRQLNGSASSTNGIVGVRAIVPVGDGWALLGWLDVGEGGSSSSWQAIAGASYQYSPTTSLKFGYRYLQYRRDDAMVDRVAMGGLYFGAGFRF